MRVRDPSDGVHFTVGHSELFEAAFDRLRAKYPLLLEALDFIEWSLQRRPREDSEPAEAFEKVDLRVFITPRTPRYPSLRVLIEVGERRVYLWHIDEREQP